MRMTAAEEGRDARNPQGQLGGWGLSALGTGGTGGGASLHRGWTCSSQTPSPSLGSRAAASRVLKWGPPREKGRGKKSPLGPGGGQQPQEALLPRARPQHGAIDCLPHTPRETVPRHEEKSEGRVHSGCYITRGDVGLSRTGAGLKQVGTGQQGE